MEKQVRCPCCDSVFEEASILELTACPSCHSQVMFHYVENDVTITINWDALRIIANWAYCFAEKEAESDPLAVEELELALRKVRDFKPPNGDPLTFNDMIKALREKGIDVDNINSLEESMVQEILGDVEEDPFSPIKPPTPKEYLN